MFHRLQFFKPGTVPARVIVHVKSDRTENGRTLERMDFAVSVAKVFDCSHASFGASYVFMGNSANKLVESSEPVHVRNKRIQNGRMLMAVEVMALNGVSSGPH